MTRRTRLVLAVLAAVLAAGAASAFRSPGSSGSARAQSDSPRGPVGASQPQAGQAAGGARRETSLQAEIHTVRTRAIQSSVRTTGTLTANEAVTIVSELSRRLVAVKVAEGTLVEKGEVLFKLDDSDLRAELAKLEVRRSLAASSEKRQRELLERAAVSEQEYERVSSELRLVQAEAAALQVTLSKTELRAPFRARVGLRRASEGAWVTPSTPLTTLQDTSRMKVDFTLPERYAGSVAIGQRFTFQVAGRGQDFEGSVVAVEPALDTATRSVQVRGITENAQGELVPGAFASVQLELRQSETGIQVPAQAVVPTASGHAVFVVDAQGRAELREVQVGSRSADSVEIQRGLAEGDAVIVSNLLRMRPGIAVQVQNTPAAEPQS